MKAKHSAWLLLAIACVCAGLAVVGVRTMLGRARRGASSSVANPQQTPPALVSVSPTGSTALVWQSADASSAGSDRLGLVGLADGSVRWIALPGVRRGGRVYWTAWASSADALAIEAGDARHRDVFLLDASGGGREVRGIYTYSSPEKDLALAPVLTPALSPDGRRLLVMVPAGGSTDVRLVSTRDGQGSSIATLPGGHPCALAAWSTDGKKAYVGVQDVGGADPSRHELWAIEGPGELRRMCQFSASTPLAGISVQRGGEWVLLGFVQRGTGGPARLVLWLVKGDGTEMEELRPIAPAPLGLPCEGMVGLPRWAPEGRRILYHTADTGGLETGEYRILTLDERLDEGVGDYWRAEWLPGTPYLLVQDPPNKGGGLRKVDTTGQALGNVVPGSGWSR